MGINETSESNTCALHMIFHNIQHYLSLHSLCLFYGILQLTVEVGYHVKGHMDTHLSFLHIPLTRA